MENSEPSKNIAAVIVRWTARILGTLLFLTIAMFAVGEGVPNPLALTLEELVGFVAILMIAAGYVVGWKWDLAAGVLILAGIAMFCATEIVMYHRFPKLGWFFWTMAVPGVLYLVSGLQHKCRRRGLK